MCKTYHLTYTCKASDGNACSKTVVSKCHKFWRRTSTCEKLGGPIKKSFCCSPICCMLSKLASKKSIHQQYEPHLRRHPRDSEAWLQYLRDRERAKAEVNAMHLKCAYLRCRNGEHWLPEVKEGMLRKEDTRSRRWRRVLLVKRVR